MMSQLRVLSIELERAAAASQNGWPRWIATPIEHSLKEIRQFLAEAAIDERMLSALEATTSRARAVLELASAWRLAHRLPAQTRAY